MKKIVSLILAALLVVIPFSVQGAEEDLTMEAFSTAGQNGYYQYNEETKTGGCS